MFPRFAQRACTALAENLFDLGQGIPRERIEWMLGDAADFVDRAGPKTKGLLLILLFVIEHFLPLFVIGKPRRMSRLGTDDRDRFLAKVDASSLAVLLALPKAILGLVYFEHPDVQSEIGYDRQPLVLISGPEAKS